MQITGTFEFPESLKLNELQTTKRNIDDVVNAIASLTSSVSKEIYKIKVGVELDATEQESLSTKVDTIIADGKKVIEEQIHNVEVSIHQLYSADDPDGQRLIALFSSAFSSLQTEATAQGEKVRSAMMAALKDGKITPEEAAGIERLIAQYNEIVNISISDLEGKANIRRIIAESDGMVLDKGSIQKIQKEAFGMVSEAIGNVEASADSLKSLYASLDISPDTLREVYASIDDRLSQKIASANLEGFKNTFKAVGDSAKGALSDIANESADEFGDKLKQAFSGAQAIGITNVAWASGNKELNEVSTALMSGVSKENQKAAKAAYDSLRPSAAQLEKIRDEAIDAGREVPEGIDEALRDINLLNGISRGVGGLSDALVRELWEMGDESGKITDEAIDGLIEAFKNLFSGDYGLDGASNVWNSIIDATKMGRDDLLALLEQLGPNAGEVLGESIPPAVAQALKDGSMTIQEAVEQILSGTTIEPDVNVDPNVEVSPDALEDTGEEAKQNFTEAVEGAGDQAAQQIADELEAQKPIVAAKGEEIAAEVVQQFLERLSASEAAEIATAFCEGIVEAMQQAYDDITAYWEDFPQWMYDIFRRAQTRAYEAFKPIVSRMKMIAQQIKDAFNDLPDKIGSAFEDAAKRAETAFAGLADKIQAQAEKMQSALASAAGAMGASGGGAEVKKNAVGGIYDSPTETMVGEEGKREYIIPTAYPDRAFPMIRSLMSDRGINADSLQRAQDMLGSGNRALASPVYNQQSYMTNNNSAASNTTTNNNNITAPVNVSVTGFSNPAQIAGKIDGEMRRHIRNLSGRIVTA